MCIRFPSEIPLRRLRRKLSLLLDANLLNTKQLLAPQTKGKVLLLLLKIRVCINLCEGTKIKRISRIFSLFPYQILVQTIRSASNWHAQMKHTSVFGCKNLRLTQKSAIRCRIYIAEMCGMLNFRKLLQKNLLFTVCQGTCILQLPVDGQV